MQLRSLAKIAKIVERYMIDEIVITRRDEGSGVINGVTLAITFPITTVYEGRSFIAPMGSPAISRLGENQEASTVFEVAIPREADPVKPHDLVTVVTSQNNPFLEGQILYVNGEIQSTFYTHRRISCVLREPAE